MGVSKFAVNDWVIWCNYVCHITDANEFRLTLQPIGFENSFDLPLCTLEEEYIQIISEQEAILLILKNHKPYLTN